MKTMGDRIRVRLKELNRSQHWLAQMIGIKQPSINALIKGDKARGSKHAVGLAEALGVNPKWLTEGVGPRLVGKAGEALVVGYVGAGAEVHRFEEGVVMEAIDPPPGEDNCLAAIVRGDSQYPALHDGWLIFYRDEHSGVTDDCIGKLSVAQIKDGPTMVKVVRRGTRGKWTLESWNAPPIENVALVWASRVIAIKTN